MSEPVFEVLVPSFWMKLTLLAFYPFLSHCSFIADGIARSVSELYNAGLSVGDAISALAEDIVISTDPWRSDITPFRAAGCLLSAPEAQDRACLAALIPKKLSEIGIQISEQDFLEAEDSPETFTYVRAPLADEAYDVFSQDYEDARVFYSGTMRDACVAVADGAAGYCILPFEERGGVRVPIIADLAARLGLKIVGVTPVFGFEGTADMKYALLKRGFVIPERDEDTDRYLEIKLPCDFYGGLAALLAASESFGTSVYRINTLGSAEDAYYSLVFKDGGGGFTELLIYLSVFVGSYLPIGIYKNLE